MNFFAHALFAARRRPDAPWILGSMVPDLASMAGLRLRHATERPRLGVLLGAGIDFHHATDDAFHRAPKFQALEAETREELKARGLSGGPAMAIGHVGVELLLDGWLVGRHGVSDTFRAAVAIAGEAAHDLCWHASVVEGPARWQALCARLPGAPVPEGYADPDFVAALLIRILSSRPRLAVDPGREDEVFAWARRAAPVIAARAEALLEEVEARLAGVPTP